MRYVLFVILILAGFFKVNAQENGLSDSVETDLTGVILPRLKINLHEFINNQVRYPREAMETGLQGTVYVMLIVRKNGDIDSSSIHIGKGLPNGGGGLNNEALRITHLIPANSFEPAVKDGKPVSVWLSIPVKFSLDSPKKEKRKKSNSNRDEK
jgi:TonB family protein